MRRLELEEVLARRLKLAAPRFKLHKIGNKLAGSIVSNSFRRKTDSTRQKMIWDAIESEFGSDALAKVGTLLAYSDEEWDIDLPAKAG